MEVRQAVVSGLVGEDGLGDVLGSRSLGIDGYLWKLREQLR